MVSGLGLQSRSGALHFLTHSQLTRPMTHFYWHHQFTHPINCFNNIASFQLFISTRSYASYDMKNRLSLYVQHVFSARETGGSNGGINFNLAAANAYRLVNCDLPLAGHNTETHVGPWALHGPR